jgi:two-component sensor histidine kinase
MMSFFKKISNFKYSHWVIYAFLTILLVSLLYSSQYLLNYLKKDETKSIQLFASAIKINNRLDLDEETQALAFNIMSSDNNIPTVMTDHFGAPLQCRNIDKKITENAEDYKALIKTMAQDYEPIEIQLPDGKNQYVYYSHSKILIYIQYYPYVLGLLILAYVLFTFWFLSAIKKTNEGFLWAGLAKETAHQIGTPLSSMMGWLEILKADYPEDESIDEFEKDIKRLNTISDRFSKIGSVPELKDLNLGETVAQNVDYLKHRLSKRIAFSFKQNGTDILYPHSKVLFSWVIENLIKNAVDAMKGEGKLSVEVSDFDDKIRIDITDSGSGISPQQRRRIFKPGYSTKSRGWGLGLSLTQRVVSDYHHGAIRVLFSEPGKGTCFRITLFKE